MCHALADDKDGDDMDSEKEEEHKNFKNQMSKHPEDQPQIVKDRMLKIERILRVKLSNNYDSVRKAFLALDADHDGFITIEDFLRNFGDNKDLQFSDLKKLI